MSIPEWVGPLTGAISLGSAGILVGIYVYGLNEPLLHEASRRIDVSAPPQDVWALLTAFERRTEWRPHIARVVNTGEVAGRPSWREFAEDGDRFDFVVDEMIEPRLILRTAKPEDLGMDATWTWTVEPGPGGKGTSVSLTERGRIDNPMYRGLWTLREGPYAAIDLDLEALAAAFQGR